MIIPGIFQYHNVETTLILWIVKILQNSHVELRNKISWVSLKFFFSKKAVYSWNRIEFTINNWVLYFSGVMECGSNEKLEYVGGIFVRETFITLMENSIPKIILFDMIAKYNWKLLPDFLSSTEWIWIFSMFSWQKLMWRVWMWFLSHISLFRRSSIWE